jgi:hypothetical protein
MNEEWWGVRLYLCLYEFKMITACLSLPCLHEVTMITMSEYTMTLLAALQGFSAFPNYIA